MESIQATTSIVCCKQQAFQTRTPGLPAGEAQETGSGAIRMPACKNDSIEGTSENPTSLQPGMGDAGGAMTRNGDKPEFPVPQGKRRMPWARLGQIRHLPSPASGIAVPASPRKAWIHIGQAGVNIMNCGKIKIERGACALSVEEMKNVDVRTVKCEGLADIRNVEINKRISRDGQIKNYLEQLKNPYCYRYGEYIVKIGFEDTAVTLTDRLRELILRTASAV